MGTTDEQARINALAKYLEEDPDLYCDHCNERIESAYAEPDFPPPLHFSTMR